MLCERLPILVRVRAGDNAIGVVVGEVRDKKGERERIGERTGEVGSLFFVSWPVERRLFLLLLLLRSGWGDRIRDCGDDFCCDCCCCLNCLYCWYFCE